MINNLKVLPMDQLGEQSCVETLFEGDSRNWPEFKFRDIKQHQHLCVRATINLDESIAKNSAVFISILAAYHLYWDGELLLKSGVVGASASEEQVGAFRNFVPLERSMLSPGKHYLALELSTFKANETLSNIAYLLMITDQDAFADTVQIVSTATAILIGILVTLFILFLTLYIRFSRQKTLLIFSLLCLVSGVLLVAEQWKIWFAYPYDFHLTRLRMVVLITYIVSLMLPGYYLLQHQIKPKLLWLAVGIISITGCLFLAENYDARSHWLFVVALSLSLFINLLALKLKRPYALPSVLVLLFSLAMLIASPLYFLELGFGLAIVLVIVTIWFSLIDQLNRQREKALETAKVKGELLRRNLQPHFLMNCLTQVQELIDTDPEKANHFVADLADEFRVLVQMSHQSSVALAHEIKLCQKHLNIMSVRYQQDYQLEVVANINNVDNILIPSAILHSQIENCFTHNRITQGQQLSLQVDVSNGWTQLTLKTPVESSVDHEGVGVGEAYIRSKLEATCGDNWQLESQQSDGFWVTNYQYKLNPSEYQSVSI